MAEIFPDEGLNYILNVIPRNTQTAPSTLYIGLFTSQTASTVASSTATGGAVPSGWTEVSLSGTTYARVAVAATSWNAPSSATGGRSVTRNAYVQFAAVGGTTWGTINGFFLATNTASGAGDTIMYFSNFSDTTAVTPLSGDVIQVLPSWTNLS